MSKVVQVVAALNASMNTSANGLKVNFTSNVGGGDGNYSYSWNFGDGSSATGDNPSHTYASAGSYDVAFTVADSTGVEVTVNKTISVAEKSSGGGGGGSGNILLLMLLAAGLVLRRKS